MKSYSHKDNSTGGANGLPIVLSDGGHSLTIEGNGHSISRGGSAPRFRFLYVSNGANLTLNNLTLSNGHGPDGTSSALPPPGGAIYIVFGATVNLNGSTITGNSTGNGVIVGVSGTQDGGSGGGIYNLGTLNIINSTISNNTTGNGAFVASGGSSGWGGDGGGVYNTGALNITDSTISSNRTGNGGSGTTFITHGGMGGGIHSEFGTLTIRGSTIANNGTGNGGTNNGTGRGDGGVGGGIAINNQSSAIITNTTITGNITGNGGSGPSGAYGGDGGGMYLFSITNLQLINLTISGNTTGSGSSGYGSGAGIRNDNFTNVTIKNTLVANNTNSAECSGIAFTKAAGQPDPTNAMPILFTAVFNEPINTATFTTADVSLSGTAPGATVASVTEIAPNDGTTFEIAVNGMTGSGTVIASIPAGGVQDLAGNTNAASTSTDNTVTYDTTAPALTSFTRFNPATSPTSADVLVFRAAFSKDVQNVDAADFTINAAPATTATITGCHAGQRQFVRNHRLRRRPGGLQRRHRPRPGRRAEYSRPGGQPAARR
jgi:hypothetical protein